jgi:glycosyltransferase involved in cell wall biosynthesis
VVDTEHLQDILYKNTGEKLPILPMFHSINFNIKKIQTGDKKVISFLSASKEKGLQEFVKMIMLFKTKEPDLFSIADFKVRVLIKTQDNLNLVQKISNIIHLAYGPLSAEEYKKLIAETDIMMLPYLSNYFQFRTSGVFTDALLNKIPVISTKKTWIGYHTENNCIGEVFDENNINDFCYALKKLLCNYQFYKDNLAAAKENWIKYHSIENFHRLISSCNVGCPQEIDNRVHKIYELAKKSHNKLRREIFNEKSTFELFRNRFSKFISIQSRPIKEE